ncbi:MAG TPA: aldehyde dehydrogenase family protein [Nocardioides sp.]|uniref:aldehyde dehydrogenase family protein n=1 Tax=Nocardioides sp. TaxID=35761 RepID=UPI002D1A4A31|nr:aldehyde dehydrogenase family protein [Nocardioides sp.]HTW15034.1 aldehyde dehydrogenase family protein [Nocardioides sp.]
METRDRIHVDGEWVEPHGEERLELIDPRSGEAHAVVRLADAADVDRAVAGARRVADDGPAWPVAERVAALRALHDRIAECTEVFADTMSAEMGSPATFARQVQVGMALATLATTVDVLEGYAFDETLGDSTIAREPVGVVAAITPWNFPLHQALAKVGAALAAGCSVVLKPAETTPLTAYLLVEAARDAGVPPGRLQLLPGRGDVVGSALARHPDVDMVSFTGSTAVGRSIQREAAGTVKRVALELGGKSPSVLLDDLDDEAFASAVRTSVGFGLMNTGQTCAAWTRLVVPEERYDDAVALASETAAAFVPGENLGPLASAVQWDRVAGHLARALDEGAEVVHGDAAPERPERGFHLAPVVFGRVTPEMAIGREEVFGPVLAIQTHRGDDDAVRLANATDYGLSAGVFAADADRAVALARRIRSGTVHVNGINGNRLAPFGGYKQSGLGREYGRFGLEEFLEVKSIQPPPRG